MSEEVFRPTAGPQIPEELQRAQAAINLPEVREMLARLAKYNLGVCMPHMHAGESGAFQVLPHDTVQMESNLEVTFLPRGEAQALTAVPVAWRWVESGRGEDGESTKAGVEPCAVCLQS